MPIEPAAPAATEAPDTGAGETQQEAPTETPTETPDENPAEPGAETLEEPAADGVVEAETDQADQDDQTAGAAVSPESDNLVRLGHVEGVLHRIPISLVLDLAASSLERIRSLQGSLAVRDLNDKVLATEGRCAPVIFAMSEDGKTPYLFSGIETIAAAMNVELDHLVVLVIAAADAGAAQSYLAQVPHNKPTPQSDDDLVRQVLSYRHD
ncbi:hypothetical protein [Sphingomonas sp.]|uniref:hypothetical protein n=1 Tax=Sphingomonas sp. TaxID=28214 RepID=UPI003B3ABCD5